MVALTFWAGVGLVVVLCGWAAETFMFSNDDEEEE